MNVDWFRHRRPRGTTRWRGSRHVHRYCFAEHRRRNGIGPVRTTQVVKCMRSHRQFRVSTVRLQNDHRRTN